MSYFVYPAVPDIWQCCMVQSERCHMKALMLIWLDTQLHKLRLMHHQRLRQVCKVEQACSGCDTLTSCSASFRLTPLLTM